MVDVTVTTQALVADIDRIPVCLLTGFLGSGKTTLLNRLTSRPEMEGTAVLINEFGEVGIDHHLVETVDDSILLLDSGCLCCTMHGDFIKTLKSLHERASRREIPPIRRVIIETTGLADPVPVIYTLMEERYVSARYVCDSVLAVVDASRGREQLEPHREAVRQIVMADRLLITKNDLSDRSKRDSLDAWLDVLNPSAPRLHATHGDIAPDLLFSSGIYSPSEHMPNVAAWLGDEAEKHLLNEHEAHQCAAPDHCQDPDHHHEHRHRARHDDHDRHHGHSKTIRTFTVSFDQSVSWRGLSVVMGHILMEHGSRLLRVKGVLNVSGSPDPMVVQCVQDVAYPPVRLKQWPKQGPLADRRGRLVFIAQNLSETATSDIMAQLSSLPNDDMAARILATNPLLPTRCWLNQRMPWMGNGSFQTEGWVVQPPIRAKESFRSRP
ncbi:putative GTP-binding protein YjiA [mine drainage metagenome]|uniref:Putative GTP-binding protein YjiA n=1 Tax=mine drainage metagenome TaxID=410659 RepID=A0A1J5RZH8_9ZZZZ